MSEPGGPGPIMGLASEYKGILAKVVLDEIETMSRENDTGRTTWAVRVRIGGLDESTTIELPLPWFEAIEKLTRRTYAGDALRHAKVLFARLGATDEELRNLLDEVLAIDPALWVVPPPVYDGDRPVLLSEAYSPRHRHRLLAPEAMALLNRFRVIDAIDALAASAREDGIRETHREVHEALAGESCPTCQWCKECER